MSSDKKAPNEIDRLIQGSALAESNAAQAVDVKKVEIEERLELLLADLGKWQAYKAASTKYVSAFEVDINSYRRWRVFIALLSAALVAGFSFLLFYLVIWSPPTLSALAPSAQVATLGGCITAIVVILIVLIKGSFMALHERGNGLPMPEHFKVIQDVLTSVIKS